MSTIKLYNYFRSSTSYRVRIALHLKELEFEYIPVHLLKNGGDQNAEEYRQINPMGGVPTLIDQTEKLIVTNSSPNESGLAIDFETQKSAPIAQSSAIIEYLDEAYPNSYQLLPKSPSQRATIRQFCQIINADTHAYANLRTLQYLEKKLNVDESDKKKWIRHWITLGLTACEKMIENQHADRSSKNNSSENNTHEDINTYYCFSNQITAAEVFLIPQLFTAERFEVNLDNYPNLKRINDECKKHPAFIKAHPFRQPDTPEELKLT